MQLILFNAAPFFMVPKEAGLENSGSGIKGTAI